MLPDIDPVSGRVVHPFLGPSDPEAEWSAGHVTWTRTTHAAEEALAWTEKAHAAIVGGNAGLLMLSKFVGVWRVSVRLVRP